MSDRVPVSIVKLIETRDVDEIVNKHVPELGGHYHCHDFLYTDDCALFSMDVSEEYADEVQEMLDKLSEGHSQQEAGAHPETVLNLLAQRGFIENGSYELNLTWG